MKVTVIGAGGFVGRALVERLLMPNLLINNENVTQIIALDVNLEVLAEQPRLVKITGSFADDVLLTQALKDEPSLIFHLASIPGGAAEQNFELGLAVNLHGTLNLFETMRRFSKPARLVFTSTIAVYGDKLPSIVDDMTMKKPHLSYGAQKYATEIILQDYSRRNWIDGRIVRLPGIVARPSQESGLLSAYMSEVFWKLSAGERFTCPVSKNAVSWFMSQACCVDNLLHAAQLPLIKLVVRRDFTLPILRITMNELINALAERFGEDRKALVDFKVNKKLESAFGCQPPLNSAKAEAIGFKNDGDLNQLIDRALASI